MVAAARPDLAEGIVSSRLRPARLPDLHIISPTPAASSARPSIGACVRHQLNTMTPRSDQRHGNVWRAEPGAYGLVESSSAAETRSHLPWAADAIPKTASRSEDVLKRSRMPIRIRAHLLVVQASPTRSPPTGGMGMPLRPDWTLADGGHRYTPKSTPGPALGCCGAVARLTRETGDDGLTNLDIMPSDLGETIGDEYVNQLPDTNPVETQEWLDSLDVVADEHGPVRARFLLD
jgi:hypothetical protein